ncbi:MAG: hypothetical protein FWG56_06955 [Desulfovibrionaceae bacterium]|nr:hypothetical protein [Desulfovibrionaceae bacterium]
MTNTRPDYQNVDDVPLTRLHLDPENPRHDPIHDEDRIIAQLFGAEKTLAVAKDIAQKGAISPLDRIGVIEMEGNPGHYIVVEGNRRACALKVLHDPQKAPNTTIRNSIESLRVSENIPNRVPVVVFRDRETAAPWLKLRHLGEQDGAGTRKWGPAAKDRSALGTTPNRLAVAVLDRAEIAGWIDQAMRKDISVTTMTRYLSNPLIRAALGLGSSSELKFTHAPTEVDVSLQNFVNDALGQNGANTVLSSRSKKDDIDAYARALHQRGVAPHTTLSAPIDAPAPQKVATTKIQRNPRSPDKRPYIVQSSFVVKHQDKNLRRILKELQTIDPDSHIFSANYLVRAAVERIIVLYALRHGFHKSGTPDHHLVKQCHEHLKNNGVPANQLKFMRMAESNKDAPYSLDTLGSAVHGAHLPTRKGLIEVWDNWETSLHIMLDRM